MKRIASVVLSLLLCVSLAVPTSAQAADGLIFSLTGQVTGSEVTGSNITAKKGDIVTVTYTTYADEEITFDTIQNEISYDTGMLKYVDKSVKGYRGTALYVEKTVGPYIYMNDMNNNSKPYEAMQEVGTFELEVIGESGVAEVKSNSYMAHDNTGKELQVNPVDLTITIGEAAGMSVTLTSGKYTGEAQEPVVAAAGKTLTADTDYTLSYKDVSGNNLEEAPVDAGAYTVTAIGTGDYAGSSAETAFAITKADGVTLDPEKDFTVTKCTGEGNADGSFKTEKASVTGLEYKLASEETWKDMAGGVAENLASGTYQVRSKADRNHVEGEAVEVNVGREVHVTGVSIDNPGTKTLTVMDGEGETLQLFATVDPLDADNKTLIWTSSNENVAKVDENGLVTAVGNDNGVDKATITVTTEDGSHTADCEITVKVHEHSYGDNKLVWEWTGTESAKAVFICTQEGCDQTSDGYKIELAADVKLDESASKEATCTAAGEDVYTAKVTCGGKEYTNNKEVSISKLGHDFEYTSNGNMITESCNLGCGHTATAVITASGAQYTGLPITTGHIAYSSNWNGEKPADSAIVYTENVGNADSDTEVTASVAIEGQSAETKFNIVSSVKHVASVTLKVSDADQSKQLEVTNGIGNSITLEAVVEPADATNKAVVWSSENPSVAKVSDAGVVTAVSGGTEEAPKTTKITVTTVDNKISAEYEVSVTEKHDHKYGAPTWLWDFDNNGTLTATAKFTCVSGGCKDRVLLKTEGISIDYGVDVVPATCKSTGTKLYTATLTVNDENLKGIFTDSTTVETEKKDDHDYLYTKGAENEVVKTCKYNCGYRETATLVAGNMKKGTEPNAKVIYSDGWDDRDTSTKINCIGIENVGTAYASATIEVATDNKFNLKTEFEVTSDVVSVIEVKLDSNLPLTIGKDANPNGKLTAIVSPDNATIKTVTWESSDENIARVDEVGWVTAVGAGTATITAEADGKEAKCEVIVTHNHSYGEPKWIWSKKDGSVKATAVFSCSADGCTHTDNKYSVEDIVVTEDQSKGEPATCHTVGKTVYNAIANVGGIDYPDSYVDYNYNLPEHNRQYSYSGNVITEKCGTPGCGHTATATLNVANAQYNGKAIENATVTYSEGWLGGKLNISYQNNIGTADPDEVTTATASITQGDVTAKAKFLITAEPVPVQGLTIDRNNLSLQYVNGVGETATLNAIVTPGNATNQKVTWESSDTSVAIVNEYGVVTAIKAGEATITATSEYNKNLTASCVVTVNEPTYNITLKVFTNKGEPVEGATLKLMQGKVVIRKETNAINKNEYTFSNVPAGAYNVTVEATIERNTSSKTTLVKLTNSDQIKHIQLQSKSKTSVVDNESDTPLSVGGVDDIADSQILGNSEKSLTVTFKVDKTDSDDIDKAVPKGHQVDKCFDMTISMTKDNREPEEIKNTGNIVQEIVIPYDFTKKINVFVYRYHEEIAEVLEKLYSEPAFSKDGTFWLDEEHNSIHVYASKFSTYGIASESLAGEGDLPGTQKSHSITVDKVANGTVSAPANAMVGEKVTVTVNPEKGYHLQSLQMNGQRITVNNGTGTFIMPDADVKLTPVFEADALVNENTGGNGGGVGGAVTSNVKLQSAANGETSFTPSSPKKGDRVTITLTPADGYKASGVIVKDSRGNELPVINEGNGKYSFEMPSGEVTVIPQYEKEEEPIEDGGKGFIDVPEGEYFTDAVQWAVENGITNGTSETTFSPYEGCTRAQMVTFLWRANGKPAPTITERKFNDIVPGSYYYDAVLWAVEKGITNGTSATTFAPEEKVSRAQTVTFLFRNSAESAYGINMPFTDVAAGSYYKDAVAWAVKNGITNGTSATTFSPADDCTRGQIVTFMYRRLA